jgi:beta-lactam-binding protein with PASTA domain
MALTSRVWSLGKLLVLVAALAATYLGSFLIGMRVTNKAREVVVPDLAGRDLAQATALLAERGLAVRVEDARRADPRVAAGYVLGQEPAAGMPTRRQRGVKVWLSDGPITSIVPALVGESDRGAQIRVQTAALTVTGLAEIRSTDYPAGTVVAQSPPAGTRAGEVRLLVNRGEAGARYLMPDLIGVDGQRAADLLRRQGFRVSVVGTQPYGGIPPGTVIRQRPTGGFQVAPGDPIALEVSR